MKVRVRSFRHATRLLHRYCRAYFWKKIVTHNEHKRLRELKEVVELKAPMSCSP